MLQLNEKPMLKVKTQNTKQTCSVRWTERATAIHLQCHTSARTARETKLLVEAKRRNRRDRLALPQRVLCGFLLSEGMKAVLKQHSCAHLGTGDTRPMCCAVGQCWNPQLQGELQSQSGVLTLLIDRKHHPVYKQGMLIFTCKVHRK